MGPPPLPTDEPTCAPFCEASDPFSVRRQGLTCVAVSNGIWRAGADYGRDFEDLGIGDVFTAVISSVDVGRRKPHPVIFLAAARAAGTDPRHCVMVGDSEPLDVEPARILGMRTILVAIEQPPPPRSAADAIATSPAEIAEKLTLWSGSRRPA